jgi:hypothetical protein
MFSGGIETHADAMQCIAETGAVAAVSSDGMLVNPALASAVPVHICDVCCWFFFLLFLSRQCSD